MIMLDQIVERLADSLGEGTDKLALRTGMHSGEVTAGVLRGEKGRFQLFGGEFTFLVSRLFASLAYIYVELIFRTMCFPRLDTVNTASRMESTGTPRRIQVSQSTADELIQHGKDNWLVPRKKKVVAKGKGEMQTYFLEWKEKSNKASDSARS